MDNETTDISDIPVEKSLRSDIGHAVAVKVAASLAGAVAVLFFDWGVKKFKVYKVSRNLLKK